MTLSERQAADLKKSIDELTSAVKTLIWRLEALTEKLPRLTKAIKSTPDAGKD